MKKIHSLLLIVIIPLALFSSLTVATMPPWEPLPRLDTQYFKVIKTEDARITALTVTEEVDMIPGPTTMSGIYTVLDWGANMSWVPSSSYGFNALQCRHVWPPEAEGGTEGKVPGETTSPMNYNGFRVALSYIFGMDDKNTTICPWYSKCTDFGIQSIIPPAQVRWFDGTAKQGITNYNIAWAWMEADGFFVDEGTLYDDNAIACRDLILYYCTGSTGWERMLPDFVAAFNDFMDNYLGVTNCNLELRDKDFETLIYGNLLNYHDYDIIAIGLTGLGADCDWIVSMFHSAYDVVGGWNFVGVHDDYIDYLMEIIQYSMDPDEIWQACSDFQHYFNGEMPQSAVDFGATGVGMMPQFLWTSGMSIQSYHPDLENFIEMPCYGSEQCELNWPYLTWRQGSSPPISGTVRRAIKDEPTNLNPFYENTLSGWLFLDGPCERLLRPHPETLEPMPWLAKSYSYVGPINTTTPSGIETTNGMVITYHIREGIYWKDSGAYEDLNDNDMWDPGEPKYEFPFTSYDCKFAADMMVKHEIPRYDTRWVDLVETQTEGPYKVIFYYSSASYWYSTYPSEFSFFPQHIYQQADKQLEDGLIEKFMDFEPAFTSYEEWMGLHPPDEWGPPPTGSSKPGYWSALVGTGPYIFGYYNKSTMVGETYANLNYTSGETLWWAGMSPVMQSLETYNEVNGVNCFKKEAVGETITLTNTTNLDLTDPACTYLHEEAPEFCNNWHIDSWKDLNDDGVLSVCDEVTLSKGLCGNGQWQGQGEYHVESIEEGGTVTLTVKKVIYTPLLAQTCICVDGVNMVWWHGDSLGTGQTIGGDIDVYFEVFCDESKIGSGWVMKIGPFDDFSTCVEIADWHEIAPCKHTFRVDLYIRLAESSGGDPEQPPHYTCSVTRVFAYLPGDANGDSIVDMIDIFTYGIKNFLINENMYGWHYWHDLTGQQPGPTPPAVMTDVDCNSVINMVDIYRMIIMFMFTCDC